MPNIGLTEVYKGDDPTIDIIAVHGLNGDAFRTWTSKKSSRMWLQDSSMLPSNLKDSRILTYGYNATVMALFGKTSADRILQHAHTLVAELVADREMERATQRPIIFICHSLGGIIVKRALAYSASRTSKLIQHLHSIYTSTFGILFLGTPHDGTSKARLAAHCRRIVGAVVPKQAVDSDGGLLDALKEGSEALQSVTDTFVPLMKNFHIFFFWEQEKTEMGLTKDYVVEESSAAPILDNTERAGLPSDHKNICRFESPTAPGYRLVVATLIRYSREAPEVISHRWEHTTNMLQVQRSQEAAELLK